MATVAALLANGFEEVEAVGVIDVLRRGGVEVVIAGVDGEMLTGRNGIVIKAETSIDTIKAEDFDLIFLPGGAVGTQTLVKDKRVQALLKAMDEKGKQIGAICAAPLALHKAGLIRGAYTAYPGTEKEIGGAHRDAKVVTEGNVHTSQGPGTAICFGLSLLTLLRDASVSAQVKQQVLAEEYC